MFKIHMLQAGHGDAFIVEYGKAKSPSRILIDGGTSGSYKNLRKRLAALPAKDRAFELLVVTHVDGDHIEGILKLLADKELDISFKDIWFNGFCHLPGSALQPQGPVQAEKLSKILVDKKLPWNQAFKGKAVMAPDSGKLPVKKLAQGMEITILGPGKKQLAALRPVWVKTIKAHGLVPGFAKKLALIPPGLQALGTINPVTLANAPFVPDDSEANGASIVLLLSCEGKRFLLAGDTFAEVLEANIPRALTKKDKGVLPLDWFKIPHHGSGYNTDIAMLNLVSCPNFLISTNGDKFSHPDREAIARIITSGPNNSDPKNLYFSCRSDFNKVWAAPGLQSQYHYTAVYSPNKTDGISLG